MSGKHLVQTFQNRRLKTDVNRLRRRIELFERTGADDRSRDSWLMEEPGQRHIAWSMTQLIGERLEALDLAAVLLQSLSSPPLQSPHTFLLLADHPAEQPTIQRRPGMTPSP